MTLKESQVSLYDHSEIKVRLLKLYLERYLSIIGLSPYFNDVHIYDMFCGEGKYEDGGEGSPIIILKTIKEIIDAPDTGAQITSRFNCQFNDIKSKKTNKLSGIISKEGLHESRMGTLQISNSDYKDLIEVVKQKVKGLKKDKCFAFIDPYGYKEITVSDIEQLLAGNKTEVLLFLPTHFMYRFSSKGTPESLKKFIDELIPQENLPKDGGGIGFIENLKDAFRNKLGEDHFVDSFIISRDTNQFFCLFFFTSHIYGFHKMLESKWKIDEEEGRGWTNSQEEPSLFNQTDRKPVTYHLEKKLRVFLSESRTNSEVYEFTLRQGHLPSHANELLMKWQECGILYVTKTDGTKARKSSFYLNYTAFSKEPRKVSMIIKTK
ncbi:MAG: three-Cys-motif partner protein TcmP [Flavobacteriales bacterium]|nr:three-Cys-motif partner protein TcmP [Flavobacteriales bacterium]